ncbi:MAG: BON domain-containing protein [Betaproteobacteria bacterium]|nr:BON domain-containing protein [Betaproteobacteria bacterium]
MNMRPLGWILAAAIAGCGPAPAQKPASAPPSLQPKLEPPRQIVVIPTPEPVALAAPKSSAAAAEDPNRDLADRVKSALEHDSPVQAAAIDVTAAGGTVTLWGTAASDDERARATRVAARIAGVKWVDNRMAIASGS